MATEAKGDGTQDAARADEQEAAGSETPGPAVTSVAAESPGGAGTAGGDEAAGAGEDGGAVADGAVDGAGASAGGGDDGPDEDGRDEDSPAGDGEAGDGADDDAWQPELTHEDSEAGGETTGEPIALAEPVELGHPAAGARRLRTRVLVAAGFVLLAAAIVGGAIAIVGSVTHGFKKPVKVTYKKSAVFSLQTGNCFNPVGQQSYTLVPCDSPHRAEVFATFPLAGTTWPGTAAVQAAASSGCATRLTGYLNPQLALSLASAYVYPDATAWQAGTRTVICEVRASSGDITGSVRGATASAG